MNRTKERLKFGYTTGACAAAAAKAAASILLLNGKIHRLVEIPFPDGSRVAFKIHRAGYKMQEGGSVATASTIKDAGDDPDVTHGAEIDASVRFARDFGIVIKGGPGVGLVTKPGLPVAVGEPAINPVPRRMICDAVQEAFREHGSGLPNIEVTISVPDGEKIAKKTLNKRLGIIGGISILGTTGIVKPLSDEAWTATVASSLSIARAVGMEEVVLSTGRTSERAHQKKYGFPDECYAMMGDFVEFSLRAAADYGFRKIHISAQWAKMLKIAMGTPQTHVRYGAIEARVAMDFLIGLGIDLQNQPVFNTTREIFYFIKSRSGSPESSFRLVCNKAKEYAEGMTAGVPVSVHLVSYEGEVIAGCE